MHAAGLASIAALASVAALAAQSPRAAQASGRASAAPATVWLCRPGVAGDPCAASTRTTVVSASGSRSVQGSGTPAPSRFDCFYVYPTVSLETTSNADLTVQSTERAAAIAQASRFSGVCDVWAPMYRQQTLAGLLTDGISAGAQALNIAYASLLAGWRDYLAHDNDGRPIIFIGHSQGAAMLIRLLASHLDSNAALRGRLVAAILLGGNVTVATGRTAGGSFHNIPACTSAAQFGCVIAYSSFPGEPPAGSLFGRPGQGVSLQSGQTATTGVQVLCVNPAAIGGGTAPLEPYFPTDAAGTLAGITTPWVEFPSLYTASCRHAGGATWLNVTASGSRSDARPRVTETAGPDWGFHTADVNLALGNLVADVAGEEAAYERAHR